MRVIIDAFQSCLAVATSNLEPQPLREAVPSYPDFLSPCFPALICFTENILIT